MALRASQQRTLALPQTGQVILLDAGEQGDIHPRDKRTPGRRLADWALNGRPVAGATISYKDIVAGGELVFEMTDRAR